MKPNVLAQKMATPKENKCFAQKGCKTVGKPRLLRKKPVKPKENQAKLKENLSKTLQNQATP